MAFRDQVDSGYASRLSDFAKGILAHYGTKVVVQNELISTHHIEEGKARSFSNSMAERHVTGVSRPITYETIALLSLVDVAERRPYQIYAHLWGIGEPEAAQVYIELAFGADAKGLQVDDTGGVTFTVDS